MSRSTISTDQESARAYFEAKRWPDGAICPACGEAERVGTRKGGFYRCNACLSDFTVRTGTIFERSKVPLHKWLYAMYLLVTARKGISSLQLAKQLAAKKTALADFIATVTVKAHIMLVERERRERERASRREQKLVPGVIAGQKRRTDAS